MVKCEHGIYKYGCNQCGGASICEHGRVKYRCKECNGSSFCEHGRYKYRCKECGGVSICKHEKEKNQCKECGGSAFCEHGLRKNTCKECGGSSICKHGKTKNYCKECGGSAFCEHGREKRNCKECGGSAICEHNKIKRQCKECGGYAFCEHGIYKTQCKECGGSAICKHSRQKSRCKECGGSQLCKGPLCETRGHKKYDMYCMPCFVNNPENHDKPAMSNYKTKEKDVVDKIKVDFPDFNWVNDKAIAGGCSKRRPDLLLDLGTHIIIIEIDENKHNQYECSCENKRVMLISQDVGHRPIVIIRFNPDGYIAENGKKIDPCWKMNKSGIMKIVKEKEWNFRMKCLKEQIKYWVDNKTEKTLEVIQLFY